MTISKSPLSMARVAYAAARRSLPAYTHPKSPKKFTQSQLAACLVLKEFFKTDYRGIAAIIEDSSDIRTILELNQVPHFTTLQKSARQLLKKRIIKKLLKGILSIAHEQKLISSKVLLAALDGSGFESHHVSRYFVQRRGRTVKNEYQTSHYQRFPKVGIVCDTNNHLILSGIPERGPKFDRTHFKPAILEAVAQAPIHTLLADAGYDGEQNHIFAREQLRVKSIIPPLSGRKTVKLPSTHYRRLMATRFNKKAYGQRWQAETVFSMLKRNLASFLRARTFWSQCREIMLRLFTHNVAIVLSR
ncbi:transposase [Patescibacteria group bacterium]|nr:transposase [Patescibacteria group bacterium]